MTLALIVSLGILGFFKYFGFFVQEANALLSAVGVSSSIQTLSLILPLGISFYTFQAVTYPLDIYYGRLRPTGNLIALATYVAFFPQLVAGPIERASRLLPQFQTLWRYDEARIIVGLRLILFGCAPERHAAMIDRERSAVRRTLGRREQSHLTSATNCALATWLNGPIISAVVFSGRLAMSKCRALCPVLLAWTIAFVSPLGAQDTLALSARLTTVPVEAATVESLTGFGSATASLDGNRLTVTGSFEDLRSPATSARLHVAAKGLRGPAFIDLEVTSGTSGKITGDVTLTSVQADRLRRGQVYLQLHSKEAPDGNLRGWLLP